jgi:hypothetical protein
MAASHYNGLVFRTPLEARWAAFFDLAGWRYWTNPVPIGDWQPDFKVEFGCGHSECGPTHTLLVAVLPAKTLAAFEDHPCKTHFYRVEDANGRWLADGGAALGEGPDVSYWQISHGSGGGVEDMYFRVNNARQLWDEAAKKVS